MIDSSLDRTGVFSHTYSPGVGEFYAFVLWRGAVSLKRVYDREEHVVNGTYRLVSPSRLTISTWVLYAM